VYKVYVVPKCPRHFSTGAEVPRILTVVPKCLASEMSYVRSVRTPIQVITPHKLYMTRKY